MKIKIFLVLMILNTQIYSYQNSTLKRLQNGKKNLRYAKLRHANLNHLDFSHITLYKADLRYTKLYLTRNLEKARSVEDANFEGAKYLSNKQKQFLRENGAINVPENDREINFDYDFDPEEFHEKVLAVFKTIYNGSKETYNWLKRNNHKIIALFQN